jgi:MtfA peptidase
MPPAWANVLRTQFWQYSRLDQANQERLNAWVRVFVAERNWEGCDGLKVTDAMRVLIAGQAGLIVLGHDDWYFDRTPSILLYPEDYTVRDVTRGAGGGFTLVGDENRAGEAWYRGPIILSWPDVVAGGQGSNGGHNLVMHEFSHHLDMIDDRFADGKPPIADPALDVLWDQVVPNEFARLQHQCAQGIRPLMNCYGATNEAEFFAVASETFFQRGDAMNTHMPELYRVLSMFYRMDPKHWA